MNLHLTVDTGARFGRRPRRGMTSLQSVILLGAGFLVVWGLMAVWDGVSDTAQKNAELTLRGQYLRPAGAPAGQAAGPLAGERPAGSQLPGTDLHRRALPTETIEGVTTRPDGRIVSTPINANADGYGNFVTNEEQARTANAIEVAVARSPHGIAIVGGNHSGWIPSMFDLRGYLPGVQAFDHVAIAIRVGDRVEILEMLPDEDVFLPKRNYSSPAPGSRDLTEFSRGYDTVHAVPVPGITAEQAEKFVAALREITAPGKHFGFASDAEVFHRHRRGDDASRGSDQPGVTPQSG